MIVPLANALIRRNNIVNFNKFYFQLKTKVEILVFALNFGVYYRIE